MIGATIDGIDVLVANLGGHYRAIGSEYTHAGCALGGELDAEDFVTCACGGPSRRQRRRRPRARRRC
jgi:nitrite reductase/ring-hydroxylating ferredoxin subunit